MEIMASLGWILCLASVLILYGFSPYFLNAEEAQSLMARNQGSILATWISGLYSIVLGGGYGHVQVSRGANLFYRAAGSSDVSRMVAISLACTTPLVICGGVTFLLLTLSNLIWGKGVWVSFVSVFQFSLLFYLPFLACCFLSVGVGARISSGAGAIAGLTVFVAGSFLPPLLSIAAAVGPAWMETLWALLPHFYAMDWSPAVIYMWDPAEWVQFGSLFFYGTCWAVFLFVVGSVLFYSSPSQNE